MIATGLIDAPLRAMRWVDLGNDDPRLPPAFMIEFTDAGFEPSIFDRHGIHLPASLRSAAPKRQAEFLMGRLAARHAIERLGIPATTTGIGLSREPLWQAGVTGSISHTSELAVAVAVAASTTQGVGIDIERTIQADALEAILGSAITPSEQALLERHARHIPIEKLFTIGFSAKESFFKGSFHAVGRYFDFDSVQLSQLDADTGRVVLTIKEALCGELPKGRSFPLFFKILSKDTVATSFIW